MFLPAEDFDIEVFGCNYGWLLSRLIAIQAGFPELKIKKCDAVGKSFGVVKVATEYGDLDFSIPRKETRIGVAHTEFECEFDPDISVEAAAARRDFTINSMARGVDGQLLDPWNGQRDIDEGILRATSAAYMEDPLRVLRGMQFASRFNLEMEPNTILWSQGMLAEYDSIPVERIWMEWKKWANGTWPSLGLRLLEQTNWLNKYPELELLRGVPQDPEWHPEGDVWVHTLHVVDKAALLGEEEGLDEDDQITLVFAALLHDVGKPSTTTWKDGAWRSPQHADTGSFMAEDFLLSIGAPQWLIDKVRPLVKEHMIHINTEGNPTKRVIQRLSRRLEPASIWMLRLLVYADYQGRPPLEGKDPLMDWQELADIYGVADKKPVRILMGRHLLEAGMKPGPEMGRVLDAAYEAQLNDEFSALPAAVAWANDFLAKAVSR
jgi:tRNA nucleotidyltransferase (CCA-adding enzyme)